MQSLQCNSKQPSEYATNIDPSYFKVSFVPDWMNQFQVPEMEGFLLMSLQYIVLKFRDSKLVDLHLCHFMLNFLPKMCIPKYFKKNLSSQDN